MEEQLSKSGEYIDTLINLFVVWGPKLIGAILALIIGLYLANMIAGAVGKQMEKRELDPSLQPFLKSLIRLFLRLVKLFSSSLHKWKKVLFGKVRKF